MRGLAPKLAVGVGSLALALLGVEVLLRVKGYAPLEQALEGRIELVRPSDFPGRGYELVPGAQGQGWGTVVAVNAHGFRGPELDPATAGRTRIVALGDSITFGNDLPYEHTWPAVLEREQRARGAAVDVLNLGLGGYDTSQEVATLVDLGLAFRPAHVVVAYCVNDLGIVSMSMETAFVPADRANPLFRSRLAQGWHARAMERRQRRALYERNREEAYARAFAEEIAPLPEALAAPLAALRARVASAPTQETDLATRRIPPRWYASEARLGRLSQAFAQLATLARQHGFEVRVLLVPYLEDDALILEGVALVRALAEHHGLRVVDPRPAFLAAGLAQLRIRPEDPVHPDAAGHALLAAAVAEDLARAPVAGAPPE
ncbi:MAG TPA: GDSL-type esterase/lipase family protein [Planctomycetota bacterium]